MESEESVWCRFCERDKPAAAYGNARPLTGRDVCLSCREEDRAHKAWRKHGLTWARGTAMRLGQDNVCKLCSDPNTAWTRLVVDHDHRCCAGKTGCAQCVRGLLCTTCNSGLGLLKDDPEVLARAVRYLKGELE